MPKEYFIFGTKGVRFYDQNGPHYNACIPYCFDSERNTATELLGAFQGFNHFVKIPREHYNIITGAQRFCTSCRQPMNSGFVVGGGMAYYCGNECLHEHITLIQWKDMAKNKKENYYAEWEDKGHE